MAGDNKSTFDPPTRLPELTQNLIRSSHGHSTPFLKISCKSVQLFSRNFAGKERNKERKKERNRSKTIACDRMQPVCRLHMTCIPALTTCMQPACSLHYARKIFRERTCSFCRIFQGVFFYTSFNTVVHGLK